MAIKIFNRQKDSKQRDFKFDAVRGYTSLDGNGNPKWDIKKQGSKVIFKNRKTSKIILYTYGKQQQGEQNKNKRGEHNAGPAKRRRPNRNRIRKFQRDANFREHSPVQKEQRLPAKLSPQEDRGK